MTNPNDQALEVLARRRLELTARRDEIVDAISQVDTAIMTLLEPGEAATVDGNPVWIVQPGARRWNEDKAREVLPPMLLDACTITETRLDPKAAKAQLPPDLYAQCTVEGKPYVKRAK